ncbi:MAG: hypothetical protein ACKOCW_10910 [Planctomycetaceae bacterium]
MNGAEPSGDPIRGEGASRRTALAIVFALDIEADAFAASVDQPRRIGTGAGLTILTGNLAGRAIAWAIAGVGMDRARRAAALLVAGHRPEALVSAGFAGGLEPRVPRGALLAVDRALRAGSPSIDLERAVAGPLPCETIVTVDAPVVLPTAKRALAATCGAALVDMETYAVAAVAASAGIRCLGLRVVSDAVEDPLPAEIVPVLRPQSGWRRFGAVVGAVGRRPGVSLELWRLWERAVADGRRLATGLRALSASDGRR